MSDFVETNAVDTATETTQDVNTEQNEVTTPENTGGITIKYNHAFRELTADEAKTYAQMGVRYESITPMLDKLKAVAAYNGKTVAEVVDALAEKDDADMRQKILDECKGDEALAERLIEVERQKRGAVLKAAQDEEAKSEADAEEALHKRLAEEFIELQTDFPDITELKMLPKSVVEDALKNNKSLLSAYLMHNHKAELARKQAESVSNAAAKASAGSAGSDAEGGHNPAVEAFRKAFRGKF